MIPAVDVLASKATRHDIVMNVPATSQPQAPALVATPAAAPAPVPTIPEALQAPDPVPESVVDKKTPWADVGYVGWMNGNLA